MPDDKTTPPPLPTAEEWRGVAAKRLREWDETQNPAALAASICAQQMADQKQKDASDAG